MVQKNTTASAAYATLTLFRVSRGDTETKGIDCIASLMAVHVVDRRIQVAFRTREDMAIGKQGLIVFTLRQVARVTGNN